MTPWALISPARLAGSGLLRTQSDARLVDLVRAGNDRAFEAIVLRYHRPLLRHCRRLLPAGRAEDAVQQTFLHALEAMRADRRELQLAAWLHRIAHNTAIDGLRRLDSHWEELDERMDGVEPTHAAVERRARFRSVVASLGSLPERQRRALVLRELEGRSYEEIAAMLGVSGAGVRQLLNRARNAMRAGASALVPATLVGRLAGTQAGVRVAELVDAPGTSALLAKATAAVAAGAIALIAVTAPGDRLRSPQAHARPHPPALESRPDTGGRSADRATAPRADVERRRDASREQGGRQDGGRGGGRAALGRNVGGPGAGHAGEDLHADPPPVAAPRPRRDSVGGGEASEDDASGGSHEAAADPPDVDDDDAMAGGGDTPNDAEADDDGADDAVSLARAGAPDDGAADDGDAVALGGDDVAESPAGAGEDDAEDGDD